MVLLEFLFVCCSVIGKHIHLMLLEQRERDFCLSFQANKLFSLFPLFFNFYAKILLMELKVRSQKVQASQQAVLPSDSVSALKASASELLTFVAV